MVKKTGELFYNTITTSRNTTSTGADTEPKPLFTNNNPYIGIDKIGISIPLLSAYSDGSAEILTKHGVKTYSNGTLENYAKGTIKLDERTTIFIKLERNGESVYLEFNPSRILDYMLGKTTSTLCPVESLPGVTQWVIEVLKDVFRPNWLLDSTTGQLLDAYPAGWRQSVSIRKLAIARDFYIDHPAFALETIEGLNKPYYKTDRIYRNKKIHNTIEWGKRPQVLKFYNKHNAPKHNVPKGWWRFEIEFLGSALKKKNLGTLDRLEMGRIHKLIKKRWQECHLDSQFVLGSNFSEFVAKLGSNQSPRKVVLGLGLALIESKGIDAGLGTILKKEYSKLFREVGFSLGDDIENMTADEFYLDIRDGRLKPVFVGGMSTTYAHGWPNDKEIEQILAKEDEVNLAT